MLGRSWPHGGVRRTRTWGRKMSEIKSLAAPKASFDRRSVVKGAAWSVPVIAAAIAAPAAAASHTESVTASLEGAGTAVTYVGSPDMAGTTPKSVKIVNNTHATINANASVTITITPIGPATAGIRIGRIVGGNPSVPGTWTTANAITTTFTVPVNMLSGASQSFDFDLTSYSHNAKGAHSGVWNYTLDMVVTLGAYSPSSSGALTLRKK